MTIFDEDGDAEQIAFEILETVDEEVIVEVMTKIYMLLDDEGLKSKFKSSVIAERVKD